MNAFETQAKEHDIRTKLKLDVPLSREEESHYLTCMATHTERYNYIKRKRLSAKAESHKVNAPHETHLLNYPTKDFNNCQGEIKQ